MSESRTASYICDGHIELEISPSETTGGIIQKISLAGLTFFLFGVIENRSHACTLTVIDKRFSNVKGDIKLIHSTDGKYYYMMEFTRLGFFDSIRLRRIIGYLRKRQNDFIVMPDKVRSVLEKRKSRRFPINAPIAVRNNIGKVWYGDLKNIGSGGVGIILAEKIELGSIYQLEFSINDVTLKSMRGKIGWWMQRNKEFFYGIHFTRTSTFSMFRFHRLLKQYLDKIPAAI
ncbi:MAG: hypothetical protein A2297_00550 [Elusimicrobia bacterium RIFOXYB2_FULL_48_7]|nr:MAG: hypothetical protein A2297_00550 [Elusimicrobia bacterium RIFOXYB2_FULL_48_7]